MLLLTILHAVTVKYSKVSLMSSGTNVLFVKNGHVAIVHAWVVRESSLVTTAGRLELMLYQ